MRNTSRKYIAAALLSLILLVAFSCAAGAASAAKGCEVVQKFEGGTRYALGSVNVADLRGTWRQMGRQYGALMAPELKHVYEAAIIGEIALKKPENMQLMRATADAYYANAPFRFRELLAGMAETSGLKSEELMLVNSVEQVSGLSQCSGLAAWGSYAAGPLVYGRNYDYFPAWFKKLAQDITVAVFHPGDGSLAVLTVGYAGEMYAVNGLNEKGIFAELNNGTPSGGSLRFTNRTHITQSLFSLLLEAPDLKYADAFFHTTNSSGAFIIGVADGERAKAYEWTTFAVVDSEAAADGLMVVTNHFADRSWGLAEPTDKKSWLSLSRKKNLTALAEKRKGRLDAEAMMEVVSTPYEQGGAALADFTMYQLVTVPKKLQLWLRIPNLQGWTQIDAAKLLSGRL